MSDATELVAIVLLAWIGYMMWEIRAAIRALVDELSTYRWERGQRESLRLDELRRRAR